MREDRTASARLRIAHLEAGRHLYGGALQVKYLLQGLRDLPADNILICAKGSAVGAACRGLAKIVETDLRGDLDITQPLRLRRILQNEAVDLLHVHSRRGADTYGALAAKLAAMPALLSRRVDNPEPSWLARFKYNRAYAHTIAISEGIERVLLSEGAGAQRLSVIRDAVDTEAFRPWPEPVWFRSSFPVAEEDFVVGVVAQLIERKGHALLLEVLPGLLKKYPRVKVLLFGKGLEEQRLRLLVERQGLAAAVHFCGFRDDMQRVLPNLDLLVHPAMKEGLGVALLQASACQVPIVAARVGGIPEAVADGETGILFSPGSALKLQAALERLLENPALRRQMAVNGRARMEQQFGIGAMARAHWALYQKVVLSGSC